MSDVQTNKQKNPTIQHDHSEWDFIEINPELLQKEVNEMNRQDVLDTLVILKSIDVKHHTDKSSDYFFSSMPIKINENGFEHNAKQYSNLEFLKVIRDAKFSKMSFQQMIRNVVAAWDSHSF